MGDSSRRVKGRTGLNDREEGRDQHVAGGLPDRPPEGLRQRATGRPLKARRGGADEQRVRPAAAAGDAPEHPAVLGNGSAAPPGLITVLVAEDDAGLRLALDALISSDPSLAVVATAADADEAIALAELHRPQVCVLDVSMPAGGGSRATRAIRLSVPSGRIIALSGHQDCATVVELLRAGAAAYLVKGGPPNELLEAIHAAASGRRVLSSAVTDEVVGELAEQLAREEAEAR